MSNRDLKLRVWKRDGVRCRYCGAQLRIPPSGQTTNDPRDATVDHIVPVAKGGRTRFRNLITACLPCNQAKGARDALDFRVSRPGIVANPLVRP